MVCLWFVYGLSMVCLWFVYGFRIFSMVCLWFWVFSVFPGHPECITWAEGQGVRHFFPLADWSEKPICGIPARLKNLACILYWNINWLNFLNLQLLLCYRYLKHQPATYVDTSRAHPQRWVCNHRWQFHSSKRSGLHVSQRGAIQRAPSLAPERGLSNKGFQLFFGSSFFWIKKGMGWHVPIRGRKIVGYIPPIIWKPNK